MTLSSRRGCSRGLVGGVVAEHGPQNVEASAGQGDDGLGVGLALGSLAVVVDASDRVRIADLGQGSHVDAVVELTVPAARESLDVAGVGRALGR